MIASALNHQRNQFYCHHHHYRFTEHPGTTPFYTLPSDAEALFLEIPLELVKGGQESPPFIFSATYARGAYDDSSSLLLLHEPAEATDHVTFTFNVTSDHSGVDVIRKQFGVRTTSPDDALAVNLGTLSSRVATLPIAVLNRHENPSVVVDASALIAKGFFIADVTGATDARLRMDLCRSFPTNFDITAEYLVSMHQFLLMGLSFVWCMETDVLRRLSIFTGTS